MIKVLHIVESFTGGVVTYLRTLVNGLDGECQSYILFARRSITPQNIEELFPKTTVLIPSVHLTRELKPGKDLAAFFEIRRVVRQVRPDVVHLHSSKAGALGRWAINGKRIPLFYTPNGYSFLMDQNGSCRKRIYFFLEAICGCRACKTVACGKGEYEQSLRVTKDATYVNNAVDTEELDRLFSDMTVPHNGISVCTLARIDKQKNPELFNRIAQAFPTVKFVWIGDGEMRDVLISPNIEITGWLPHREAIAKLLESDVFLLPSLWEGLPLALLEAMYLRRICVVSSIAANANVIENGKSGYLCRDVSDYIEVLEKIRSEGIETEMMDYARTTVARNYSQGVMSKRYLVLYNEALERIRGGHLMK